MAEGGGGGYWLYCPFTWNGISYNVIFNPSVQRQYGIKGLIVVLRAAILWHCSSRTLFLLDVCFLWEYFNIIKQLSSHCVEVWMDSLLLHHVLIIISVITYPLVSYCCIISQTVCHPWWRGIVEIVLCLLLPARHPGRERQATATLGFVMWWEEIRWQHRHWRSGVTQK